MAKAILYLLMFALVMSFSSALFLEKDTVIDPGNPNINATIGKNTTVNNLTVYYSGFEINTNNFTWAMPAGSMLVITELNYSEHEIYMKLWGNNTYINWSITNLPANSTVLLDGVIQEVNSDGLFRFNHTFAARRLTIKSTNMLIINLYDEDTGTFIVDPAWLIAIYSSFGHNYTLSSYPYPIEDLVYGNYELRYGSAAYRTKRYFFTLNSASQTINLYTNTNTSSSLILFSISDEKGNPVYNATIRAFRYYPQYSGYVQIDMERTDANGETGMYLIPYNIYYYFVVEKDDETVFIGQPQRIYASTQYIRVTLLEDVLLSMQAFRTAVYNLSYNNNTKIVRYIYNDPLSIVRKGCLKVMGKSYLTETTIANSCLNLSSGTILVNLTGLLQNNVAYTAYGYLDTNTEHTEKPISSLELLTATDYQSFGKAGLFIAYIFISVMFFLGLLYSFTVAMIYSVLAMIVINLIGVSFFGWAFIVTICVFGLLVAIINRM